MRKLRRPLLRVAHEQGDGQAAGNLVLALSALPGADSECTREKVGPAHYTKGEAMNKIETLKAALEECVVALTLAVRPLPMEDPTHGADVKALGERIGYGAMMTSASASWRKRLTPKGMQGGEFCAGPCVATAQDALDAALKALGRSPSKEKK